MASDRFSLLALRRRSVALWMVALGSFSLAISYVVPVAATLAAGNGGTISPLRVLSAPTLEFPALAVPTITANPQSVPPAPNPHQMAPAQSGASSAASGFAPQTIPVVTNAYTTRPAPPQPKGDDANLPAYEDSIGTIPTMPSLPGAAPSDAQVTPPADTTAATATDDTAAAATSDDGWAPASNASTTTQSPQHRRWLSASHGSISSSGSGAGDPSTIEESAPDLTAKVTPVATTIDTPSAPTTTVGLFFFSYTRRADREQRDEWEPGRLRSVFAVSRRGADLVQQQCIRHPRHTGR
jgi:hypothetical protein